MKKKIIIATFIILGLSGYGYSSYTTFRGMQNQGAIASMQGITSRAQTIYSTQKTYVGICEEKLIKEIIHSVENSAGNKVECNSEKEKYAVQVELKGTGRAGCVDSSGFEGNIPVVIQKSLSCK